MSLLTIILALAAALAIYTLIRETGGWGAGLTAIGTTIGALWSFVEGVL